MSDESKRHIMKDLSNHSDEMIKEQIAKGNDGKLNGDNLDIYVTTNDIRMDNKNKDYHFFASDITFDRVKISHLNNLTPIGNAETIELKEMIPSLEEDISYKTALKVILSRVIVEYCDSFSWMKPVIPKHISHPLQDEMSTKSSIHWLPIMLKNEAKYADCVQIMASYEDQLSTWYRKAGRGGDLDKLQVPVGGDQLTRVRLQGAKSLRAGAFTAEDRLEHLTPIVVEMFHTLQDFLEKMYKRFFKTDSGRDKGTLYSLKLLIQRSNVNGKVKSRFEAHEDFALTVGCAYFLIFIMQHFEMKDLNDTPKHPKIQKNIKMMHNHHKKELWSTLMNEIVDELVETFPKQATPVKLQVEIYGQVFVVHSKKQGNMLAFELFIGERKYIVNITPEQAAAGAKLSLNDVNNTTIVISVIKEEGDDLYNYVNQFMQWYLMILSFKDTISEGDIYRNNINLKFCIPFFFSHSNLSKYMTECIDYILKTEIMLSEKMALKVRASSFVNITGRKGENKAADLQKENQVMVLKDLIRGLGSNKTENSIVTISKAAPVVKQICENVDNMLGVIDKKTRHKKRSVEDDVKQIIKELQPLKPWVKQTGRQLYCFKDIKRSPFSFNRTEFETSVTRTINRLKRDLPPLQNEGDEDEDEEDSDEQ
ncbi:uncharacterized protein LOC143062794 [Mytilus galloprovincialis]|uniref:uncharacterized protein LOC143062794 n=1 Tax=Mytilus galloprovincialis TaxID=29158 RepID=UPI003F7CB79E